MKHITTFFIILYLFTTFLSSFYFPLLAQNNPLLDDFEEDSLRVVSSSYIKPTSISDSVSFKKLWQANGQGYMGTYYNHGKYEDTYAGLIRVTYAHPYNNINLVSTIDFLSVQKTIYGYERDNPILSKLQIKKNDIHFRELYAQSMIGEKLQIQVGRQLLVWGQTPLYSVIDFILPMDMDINPLRVLRKVDRRIPLNMIHFSYFPVSQLEFSATVFESMTPPSLIKKQFELDLAWYKANHLVNLYWGETSEYVYNPDSPPTIIYEDKQKPMAFRALWRRPSFSAGFTYFEGMHWDYVETNQILHTTVSINQEDHTRFYHDLNNVTFGFYKKKAWAIELSKHFWDYTFTFELSRELLPYVVDPILHDYFQQTAADTNLTWMYRYFSSLGLHADYPWFNLTFILFGIFDDYRDFPGGDIIQPWRDQKLLNSLFFSSAVSINLPKSTKLGAGLGLLPYGVGIRFFLSSEFRETWQWNISPQYVTPLFEDGVNFAKKHGATLSFSLSRQF